MQALLSADTAGLWLHCLTSSIEIDTQWLPMENKATSFNYFCEWRKGHIWVLKLMFVFNGAFSSNKILWIHCAIYRWGNWDTESWMMAGLQAAWGTRATNWAWQFFWSKHWVIRSPVQQQCTVLKMMVFLFQSFICCCLSLDVPTLEMVF